MKRELVIAVVIWQAAWWAGILPPINGAAAWGVVGPLIACAVHLAWKRPPRAGLAMAVAVVLALAVDGSLAVLGLVTYARGPVPAPWPALWIAASWLLFAAGMQRTMAWMVGRWWLAVVLGFLGGAGAYHGGWLLGAVDFPGGLLPGLLGVAVGYACAVPVLLWASFGREAPARHRVSTPAHEEQAHAA